jgi:hypothetical protein
MYSTVHTVASQRSSTYNIKILIVYLYYRCIIPGALLAAKSFFFYGKTVMLSRSPFFYIFGLCRPSRRMAYDKVPFQMTIHLATLQSAVSGEKPGFKPRTAGQKSGALPMSHRISKSATPVS